MRPSDAPLQMRPLVRISTVGIDSDPESERILEKRPHPIDPEAMTAEERDRCRVE